MKSPKKPSLTIKDWHHSDRPREKLLAQGVRSLSNAELLALIIGTGLPGSNAVELMKKLLKNSDHQLQKLARQNVSELIKINGIGTAKAVKIMAALGLASRYSTETIHQQPTIKSSEQAYQLLREELALLEHEEFWILYLNRAHRLLEKIQLSKGGISETVVDLRLLFKRALACNSTAIIFAHNHPSGNLTPSASDKNLTLRIKKAASFFDITLLDHLILSDKKYLSFVDKQLL